MRTTIVCLLILLSGAAYAQVPEKLVFQGRLSRADGQPETAPQNLRFAIYDAPTGGAKLWEELHSGVQLSGGFYSVTLGAVNSTPLSTLFTGPERYLSVSPENQSELLPRLPISTLPYAFMAGDSAKLGGQPASDFAPSAHTHPNATTTMAGLLSAADKAKLDSLSGTAAPPTLSCTHRSAAASFASGATAACQAGEVLTGGGCADVPTGLGFTTTASPTGSGYLCKGSPDGGAVPTSTVTAWATCCKVVP